MFKVQMSQWLICSQTCSFSLHNTLIDGPEWCELLVDYCELFGFSFWRHPFTAEDPLASKLYNAKILKICSDEETNLYTSWLVWWLINFWVNYSFKLFKAKHP